MISATVCPGIHRRRKRSRMSPYIVFSAVAAVAIGLTGCSVTGGTNPAASVPSMATAPTYTPKPVQTETAGIGDSVANGSLEFVVRGVRREERIQDQFDNSYGKAGAEYVIVSMSVRNNSTSAVFFYPTSQTLVVQGTQVEPDQNAIGALNSGMGDIQPGLTINAEVPFLVSTGTQPEAIMVSDALHSISSPGSAATRVELS
jgi:hypothetical protein